MHYMGKGKKERIEVRSREKKRRKRVNQKKMHIIFLNKSVSLEPYL